MTLRWLAFGGIFLGIALVLLPSSGQARPRDDVMSRAFRCAAIGDSHTWLDCYYGAAQPERAALGLQPAPSAQLKLVLQPPQGHPNSADESTRDQVLSQAFRCSQWDDDRRWLDCYYAAALPMRVFLGLSVAGQASGVAANRPLPETKPYVTQYNAKLSAAMAPQEMSPATDFGLSNAQRQTQARLDHIDSYMAKYSFDRYGIFTVTLANGQVWRQISGDTSYAHWNKPAQSYAVHISRGFLGSYNFQVKHSPGLFKVERVS